MARSTAWAAAGRSRQEVARKLRVAIEAAREGALALSPRVTVAQFLQRWLEDSVKPSTSSRTHEACSDKMRLYVLPSLGSLQLSKLTAPHLQRLYAQKLADSLSPTTVRFVHTVLHRALEQAKRWRLVDRNVAEEVDAPRPARLDAADRALTLEQLGRLFEAMRGHRFERFWTVLVTTGLRFGEAAALRWSDVDLDKRELRVLRALVRAPEGFDFKPPKTARGRRVIPLPEPAVAGRCGLTTC